MRVRRFAVIQDEIKSVLNVSDFRMKIWWIEREKVCI